MLAKIALNVTKNALVTWLRAYGSTPEDPIPAPIAKYSLHFDALPTTVLTFIVSKINTTTKETPSTYERSRLRGMVINTAPTTKRCVPTVRRPRSSRRLSIWENTAPPRVPLRRGPTRYKGWSVKADHLRRRNYRTNSTGYGS